RQKGYLSAHVDSIERIFTADSALVDLSLRIIEGKQTVVGSIVISGQRALSASEILAQFDLSVGDPLNEAVLEQDIEALLERYERMGYPFVGCHVAEMIGKQGVEEDSLEIMLMIDEGNRVTIDEIKVVGNKETDPGVVVREARLAYGEVYNPAKVAAIKPRLTRLNIFADVFEPELYVRDKKSGLLIKVREGNTNTFDGVIGYIPGTLSGEAGYVTGLASIAMRNLFGTGRKLSFRWQREDRFSQELGIRYIEPWVFSFPANLGVGFFQRQQDTSYVRRVVDFKAELMLSEELSVSLLLTTESVIPSADSTINRVYRSNTTSYGAELQYDTRDDIYSPTSGVRYKTDYQYGTKKVSNIPPSLTSQVDARITLQKFNIDFDAYLSTFARQVLAFGLHGKELKGGQLEEGEMYRFGGMRTLRGYRESQFLGSRVAWSNTEYRFILARRSFFYVFVDGGYYLRPADDVRGIARTDAFKYGYGLGLQLETGLGNLGVSFALGQGDSFSNGKIHFGLINEF
ncbi:MAG TPA: POTRA domain-containing protein, partial [Bacteroidota bacterium]|nr:POTRA domain-containing protein [Bacteroidota bacterium]